MPKFSLPLPLLSFLSKAAMTAAQGIATYLVVLRLGPVEQGFYYSFLSIVAIQGVFELGLSQVLVVFLSHEMASPTVQNGLGFSLTSAAIGVARVAFNQYRILAAAFVFLVGAGGMAFLAHPHSGGVSAGLPTHWLFAWWGFVCASGLKLLLIWLEAVIEGCGLVGSVLQVRIVAQVLWLLAFSSALYFGLGLVALGFAQAVLLISSMSLYRNKWPLLKQVLSRRDGSAPSDKDLDKEIHSLQRRVSGTWIASYCISYTAVPILFVTTSVSEAGRAGVSFQAAAAVGVVAGAISAPRISGASRLIATKSVAEFGVQLRRITRFTLLASFSVATVALFSLQLIRIGFPQYASRVPSALEAFPLLLAACVNSAMSCVSIYARARKREEFTFTLVLVATVILIGSLAVAPKLGLIGVSMIHGAAALAVTAPSVATAYKRTLVGFTSST